MLNNKKVYNLLKYICNLYTFHRNLKRLKEKSDDESSKNGSMTTSKGM